MDRVMQAARPPETHIAILDLVLHAGWGVRLDNNRILVTQNHWPLISTLAIFWLVIAILLVVSVEKNQGVFVYALDDPYIHMAIAKNLAGHAVWGVSPFNFTSTSSAPLWVWLLAGFYLFFSGKEFIPFVLNFLFASFSLCFIYYWWREYKLKPTIIFMGLIGIIFLAPFPALVFVGMEHSMHIFLSLMFVYVVSKTLSSNEFNQSGLVFLLILAFLLSATRYEGLVLSVIAVPLFILRKKIIFALGLLAAAFLPAIIYGGISVYNGWYFFPNSILLKAHKPEVSFFGIVRFMERIFYHSAYNLPGLILMTVLIILLFKFKAGNRGFFEASNLVGVFFVLAAYVHFGFAPVLPFEWGYRYEAYLVVLGLSVAFLHLEGHYFWPIKRGEMLRGKTVLSMLIIVIVFYFSLPSLKNAYKVLVTLPQATNNIYGQQYQMGLFVKKYYQDREIAANDIGAISYLADIKLLDLWGLGSLETARARIEKRMNFEQLEGITRFRGTKIAIIYDDLFDLWGGREAHKWLKVGEWKIKNNVICAGNKVSFYAIDLSEKDKLKKNLEKFSSVLPEDVERVLF